LYTEFTRVSQDDFDCGLQLSLVDVAIFLRTAVPQAAFILPQPDQRSHLTVA